MNASILFWCVFSRTLLNFPCSPLLWGFTCILQENCPSFPSSQKDQVPELLKLSVFSISLSFELLSLLFHFLKALLVCYFLISFKYEESSQANFKCFFFFSHVQMFLLNWGLWY